MKKVHAVMHGILVIMVSPDHQSVFMHL
jgi:hypothetical protein